jgi:Ca2+-binding EF-hand superfamily protein
MNTWTHQSLEFINDFLGLGKNQNQKKKKKAKAALSDIAEESETFTETVLNIETDSHLTFIQDDEDSFGEDKEKPVSKFLLQFLENLRKHPEVYAFLVNSGVTMKILNNYMKQKGKSLYNFSICKHMMKRYSVTPKRFNTEESVEEESQISDTIIVSKSSRKGFLLPHPYMKSKKISAISLKDSDDSSSQASSIPSSVTPANRFSRFKSKQGLQSSNQRLREIFNEITKNKPKLQVEDFKAFLHKRYHSSIVEVINNYFNFRLGSFDDYLNEFNKLINASEIRHLEFCFNIFDFNKDKKICFKDAFNALECRTGNYYDNDLRLLVEMFDLKREGKLNHLKLRRKSTLSLIHERMKRKKKDIFAFLKKDPNEKENVFLTFKEFCMIKFSGRPQMFLDIVEYTTGYNFLKERGLLRQIPVVVSRGSEFMINNMHANQEFLKIVSRNEKYDYYVQLESALSLFSASQGDDIIKKFKYLQFEEKLKYKVITKSSMVQKLVIITQPGLIGFNNPYFSERIYEFLSEGKDLTKPLFLRKIYDLVIEKKENVASQLAFQIYDSRKDQVLTVDEVYHMFEAFPLSSQAYSECFK